MLTKEVQGGGIVIRPRKPIRRKIPHGWKQWREQGILIPIEGGATYVPFSTSERNSQLTNFATRATFGGLHTAYPGDTGASEVSGGTPPYARQAITWGAAGSAAISLATAPTFNVPALGAGTVQWVSYWNLVTAGTFGGSSPLNNGESATPFTCDSTTDILTSEAHGLTNGMQAVVFDTETAILPTPLVEGTVYYVVGATTNALQLSLTSGGTAIDITAVGAGFVQRIIPQPFPTAGQLTIGSLTITYLR